MSGPELERLIALLAKLPGLGARSARRAALALLQDRDGGLRPLVEALRAADARIVACRVCGNLDSIDPCAVCAEPSRDDSAICVVESIADLWAMERAAIFRGRYHVLGGHLSALDGVGPEDLAIAALLRRAAAPGVREVILALNATLDGQTTAHYLDERLAGLDITVSRLAQGVPLGGELHYLDDGTLAAALGARRPMAQDE